MANLPDPTSISPAKLRKTQTGSAASSETKASETPERVFTYKQINEASNILAHHLHEAGVTNGDVVMIWAHRSVDLVVAIMGTLVGSPIMDHHISLHASALCLTLEKASGAIMSVLDPLYPPTRQQIYLEVAQPCALVNIAKATDEAGPLLLFEGRPKPVWGRHFSLCNYFPWMAETFNLSSESKFTLLSGIAHDPVQRDIFTPLFLGGRLLVPSKEDIQHERLAEWMREHKPTVTHLNSAMGQILVGGATAEFPSLDRAFFVGDVLTTRDCRQLQKLAKNVSIVNMFGAVSYYEIPPRAKDPDFLDKLNKDTVPAGKDMQNVQLLVIDRQDRNKICGAGEVGEIYVRAAGLAESELSEQKFLNSWFVDNNKWVEVDEQLNKNEPWQKIELNDIDSNLSQSPLIRDCKTLVRRDRNEEPTLVSYVVPELNEWPRLLKTQGLEDIEDEGTDIGPTTVYFKRFRRMQTEVDKPNLPFPDIAEQTEDASEEDLKRWEALSDIEKTIATRWSEVIPGLNAKTVAPENDFFDLGGHSLLAQQMLLVVRKTLGANVSINTLYEYPSLAGFSAQVNKQLSKADGAAGESENEQTPEYARSLDQLLKPTSFLTGATGFLGAYLIKDVLERTGREIQLIAHVRSVKDPKGTFARLRRSLEGYGMWKDEWQSRLSCVVGDLSKPQLGIEPTVWERLAHDVDIVIHNRAVVHWVKRYADMMTANVISTLDAMRLCNEGKPKTFTFVSSTSVLDNDHYVNLSDKQISTGEGAVLEEDDMMGSRTGLGTGYGQIKWVSEQLVREAARRGLRGTVVRPGYILGDIETGFLSSLEYYAYKTPEVSYDQWRDELEKYVTAAGQEKDQEQHALMPLYHFCVNDLPANTRAPELDDRNTAKILKHDAEHWTGVDESCGYGVSRVDVGQFLRYLAETNFVTWPTGRGRPLPEVYLSQAQLEAVGAVGGRGGTAKA
ncbi:hypothetical protein ACJ41O_004564 [Fusarium nematophilum]